MYACVVPPIEKCLKMSGDGIVVGVNAQKLADLFLQEYPTVCVLESKEILTYVKGRYICNGAELIHQSLVQGLAPYVKVDGKSAYNSYLYREVIDIIRGMTYKKEEDIDKDLDVINVQNGLLNWKTMTIEPHRSNYISRIQHPIVYDPDAKCPAIEKIFKMVLREEDYEKALEFIGYCFYRSYKKIQQYFILYGPGGTGKSAFIDIICNLIGHENVSSTTMHDLENDRFATSDLHNKCLNQCGDMAQTTLPNVNVLKMATSGKDVLRTQRKGKQAFDFVNFAKFIFATNKLPLVKDDTTGFYRRVELLIFDHIIKDDEKDADLLAQAATPEELSGLLNLVLPHIWILLERGTFSNGFKPNETKLKYKAASDPIGTFEEVCIKEEAGVFATKEDVYNTYVSFCKKNDIEPLNASWFGREFAKKIAYWKQSGSEVIAGKPKTIWKNMRLTQP